MQNLSHRLSILLLYSNMCNLVYCAGRGAKEANLYTEIAEGLYSYGITRHRHGNFFILLEFGFSTSW